MIKCTKKECKKNFGKKWHAIREVPLHVTMWYLATHTPVSETALGLPSGRKKYYAFIITKALVFFFFFRKAQAKPTPIYYIVL